MTFVNSSIILIDDVGDTRDYRANVDSPVSFIIPQGSTGTWTWVVDKEGFTCQSGSIDATTGGLYTNSANPIQLIQPNGTPMYTGTTSPLLDVSFAGDKCFIDIGNGRVTGQEVHNEVENALVTQAGCEFLAKNNCSIVTFIALSAGNFLFLGQGFRIRRRSPSDVNALVAAFAVPIDGVVVDGANGGVSFLSSNVEELSQAVWEYSQRTLNGPLFL